MAALPSAHHHDCDCVNSAIHMPERDSLPKRRQQSDGEPPHRPPKKQKLGHPARPPPSFYDRLSKLPLTKRVLEEFDRRNDESAQTPYSLPQTRVRPIHKDASKPAVEYLRRSPPTRLQNIKRWARTGGPDLSDLRGFRAPDRTLEHAMSQSSLGRRKRGASRGRSNGTSNTTSTKSTGPYDRAFQQHLIDFGIYPDRYEYPDGRVPPRPENIEEIKQALAQRRESLSPSRFSDEEFEKFQRADAHATKERQVTTSVIPIIQGDVEDSKCVASKIPFTNLDPLTDDSLVPGNPDLYYGARPEQLDRQIRTELSGHIVPSTQKDLPILPNFFLAVKGPDGSAAVAKRQLTYDTTLGARGYNSAQSHTAGKPVFDNKAYTIGCTYQDGQLKIYTCHPIQPMGPRTRTEFVMTQVKAYALTNDADTFRMGAGAYRNGMDWAKTKRDEAIGQANEKLANSTPSHLTWPSFATEATADDTEHASQDTVTSTIHDSNAASFYDVDTSADELSMDSPQIKRPRRRPGLQR